MTVRRNLTLHDLSVGQEVTFTLPSDVDLPQTVDVLYDEIPAIVSAIYEHTVHFRRIRHDIKQKSILSHSTLLGNYVGHSCPVSEDSRLTAHENIKSSQISHFTATWNGEWKHEGLSVKIFEGVERAVSWSHGAVHESNIDYERGILPTQDVKKLTWFHATERENWGSVLPHVKDASGLPLMVHVGSEDAAMTRMGDIVSYRDYTDNEATVGWLFELRLKDDTRISPMLLKDIRSGWWQGWDNAIHGNHDAFGYINLFEGEGEDLSLYVRADTLEVVKVIPLKYKDVPFDVIEEETDTLALSVA